MTLSLEIDAGKRTVNTDSLSFSVNEFAFMYESGELNIHPAFQRMFRWGPKQQSSLIESLLIGVPLPPFFVYENDKGVWELIDGLQRTSTILKFMGILRKPGQVDLEPPSALTGTEYLPSLANIVWEKSDRILDLSLESQVKLDAPQQLFIKRCRINVQVLKQPSDPSTKFDLFQRLNRGGSFANPQEVRTCYVVMKNPDFASVISDLARVNEFREICQLKEDDILKQQDMEYATRLICHSYRDLRSKEDLNDFLDRAIIEIADEVDKDSVALKVNQAVLLVYTAAGPQALIPTTGSRKVFTLQGLESILVGVSRNVEEISKLPDPIGFVTNRIEAFRAASESTVTTSSGMRASERILRTVPLGAEWFDPSKV